MPFNLHTALRRGYSAVRPQCTYFTHIRQWHHPGSGRYVDPELMRKIACSQHATVQYIQRNPGAIVALEDCDQDMLPENIGEHPQIAATRLFFPRGIPQSFDAMNEAQKKFIAETGGAVTLYCLGQLDYIFKTASELEKRRINSGISVGRLDLIFGARENLAVSWAVKASRATQKEDVILIYGGDHDFEPCIRQINSPFIHLKKTLTTVPQNDTTKTTLPDIIRKYAAYNDGPENSLVIPAQCSSDDPCELYNHFIPKIIKLLISKGCTTLKALQSVYEQSPWVIDAILERRRIQTMLIWGWVSLEELSCLSEEQIATIFRAQDKNTMRAALLQVTANGSPGYNKGSSK